MSDLAICATCAVQFDVPVDDAPAECAICVDPRQYVGPDGQRWTSLSELRRDHRSVTRMQGDFLGVGAEPKVGIGQRALLVPYGDSNLLWDCVALLDDVLAEEIESRGGLAGIAISHPHYWSTMVEWARRFDCPIHLPRVDERWIMRPDPAIELWDGEGLELDHGVSLHRLGGHFPGASVLHVPAADGRRGALLTGDMPLAAADRRWVSFMWSYPNMVPLPAVEVRRVADVLAALDFDVLHSAFWDQQVDDAWDAVQRSADRYVAALEAIPEV
ncbi:MBL fold metallo-hydrolase [uncultured Williamsia sp.]|uniref:MBL fold metallo-hydrolase n=1 Tax=uncultured Williamsia sp. TaxID=259311 RepID=UPI00260D0DBD|nr:MBL fold metallo-hydrolase [uncultured Williamsia sp.]